MTLSPLERRAWMVVVGSWVIGTLGQRWFPLPFPDPAEGVGSSPSAWKVNVNTAPVEDLLLLPGVGPVLARRIVEHRPYRTVEDLLRVPGVGPRTLERMRPHVVVEASDTRP